MTTTTKTRVPETTAELLNRAADLIEAGWVQNNYEDHADGADRYCAIGALDKAWVGDPLDEFSLNGSIYRRAISKLAKHLRTSGFKHQHTWARGDAALVIHWNDADDRTQAEVVALFREVAGG